MNYLTDISNVTVYQLVEYVNTTYGTHIQHNQVMTRQMPKILATEGFGTCQQIVEKLLRNNAPFEITTYSLNKQQATVVAAAICLEFLIHIVDRLDMLERKYNETNTQDSLVDAIANAKKERDVEWCSMVSKDITYSKAELISQVLVEHYASVKPTHYSTSEVTELGFPAADQGLVRKLGAACVSSDDLIHVDGVAKYSVAVWNAIHAPVLKFMIENDIATYPFFEAHIPAIEGEMMIKDSQ